MFYKVSPEEWEVAHKLLDGKPEGRVLPASKVESIIHPALESKKIHSFVVLGGKIIAMNAGDNLGKGARASVELGYDEFKTPIAIKIEKDGAVPEELEILKDRNLLIGSHQVSYDSEDEIAAEINIKTQYTAIRYLGPSLEVVLNNPNLTDAQRMDIAIKLALELDDFHRIRRKSKSKTRRAHRDFKLSNATLDEFGQVHLIDFGNACAFSKEVSAVTGTQCYLPYVGGTSIPAKPITTEQLDVFALKRCLLFPEAGHFFHRDGFEWEAQGKSILSPSITMEHSHLINYIGTESELHKNEPQKRKYYNDDTITAGSIAAILIAADLGLSETVTAKELANDQQRTLAVTGIYRAYLRKKSPNDFTKVKKQIKAAIVAAFETHESLQKMAAFSEMDQFDNIEAFSADPIFSEAFKNAKSHEQACALILVQSEGLQDYAHLIDEKTAKELYDLYQQPKDICSKEAILAIVRELDLKDAHSDSNSLPASKEDYLKATHSDSNSLPASKEDYLKDKHCLPASEEAYLKDKHCLLASEEAYLKDKHCLPASEEDLMSLAVSKLETHRFFKTPPPISYSEAAIYAGFSIAAAAAVTVLALVLIPPGIISGVILIPLLCVAVTGLVAGVIGLGNNPPQVCF